MAKPLKPEPKYFLDTLPEKWALSDYQQALFSNCGPALVYGEKSTSYIDHPEALLRIRKYLPDARVVIMLRNPVHRAISNYYFSVENGLETRSLEDVFLANAPAPALKSRVSVDPFDYIGRSTYFPYLDRIAEIFPKDNFRILILEQMLADRIVLDGLINWLELPPFEGRPKYAKKVNESAQRAYCPSKVAELLYIRFAKDYPELEKRLNTGLGCWSIEETMQGIPGTSSPHANQTNG